MVPELFSRNGIRKLRPIDVNQVGHLCGNEARWTRGAFEQMLFQQGRALREPMGQKLGGFQLLKGHSPAVLPMQGQTRKHSQRAKNPQQGAVSQPVKPTDQR